MPKKPTHFTRARVKGSRGLLTKEQMRFIALYAKGVGTHDQICASIGIKPETGRRWRDLEHIKKAIAEQQQRILDDTTDNEDIFKTHEGRPVEAPDLAVRSRALRDFAFFRKEFLGRETYMCQKEWIKWIEEEDRTILLCPRRHGKTTTVMDYAVWRIVKDRNIRILIISLNERNAKRWAKKIKAILTHNSKLIAYFGIFKPPGKAEKWTQSELIVEGANLEQEDPTIVCLGITAAMDGIRADMIIADDPVNVEISSSEDQREKTEEVILGSLDNILDETHGKTCKMICIGTRKHVLDIYRKLMDTAGFIVHTQKAVIKWEGGHARQGRILCPELYNEKGGIQFFKKQREKGLRRFEREWMNSAYDDKDTIIPADCFDNDGNLDFSRSYGDHYKNWYVVIAVDPGTSLKVKGTFHAAVIGFDEDDESKRYLIDHVDKNIPSEDQPRFLCAWYHKYGASALRIEINACQKYLSDAVLRESMTGGVYDGMQYPRFMANVHSHYTNTTKLNDPVAGLETIGHMFETRQWMLPALTEEDRDKTKALIEKLTTATYRERKRAHAVMTLWFAENDWIERKSRNFEVIELEPSPFDYGERNYYQIRN